MANAERNKAKVMELVQRVWSEGNAEAAEELLAVEYTIHHDPGDPWDGRTLDLEGYKERVRMSRAPFPDQHFEIREMFAEADAVMTTWLWTATHQGDIPGFPASGKPIRMSGATVYYFEGERITGHWQITDRLGVFQQLRQNSVADGEKEAD